MGVTDSTQSFSIAFRTQLLTHTDGGAAPNTIGAAVGTRCWQDVPPPLRDTSWPFVIYSVDRLPPLSDMDYHRRGLLVIVTIYDRPRAKLARAQRLADLADMAMTQWRVGSATDGSVLLRPPTITSPPPGIDETDKEVIRIRLTSDTGYAWWRAA